MVLDDRRMKVHEIVETIGISKKRVGYILHEELDINPLKPELYPICCLLALLGVQHLFHVSRIRVKLLTLR